MASYATPANLIARFDARTVGDLCSDNDATVAPASIPTDPNCLIALADASGMIEAALLQGKRYSVADLTGLSDNSQQYLIRLTCMIAFSLLWERRPWVSPDRGAAVADLAQQALERLRRGEHVFDINATLNAGLPKITGPTRVELEDLNLIRDQAARFYPIRRLPGGR